MLKQVSRVHEHPLPPATMPSETDFEDSATRALLAIGREGSWTGKVGPGDGKMVKGEESLGHSGDGKEEQIWQPGIRNVFYNQRLRTVHKY